MRKWVPVLLVAGAYLLSLVVYRQIPEVVRQDFGDLLPGFVREDARWAPRPFVAFALPTVALILWLALRGIPTRRSERVMRKLFPSWMFEPQAPHVEYVKFERSYELIITWVVALIVTLHVVGIGTALGWPVSAGRVVGLVLGGGMIIAGNVMPRLRPNWFAGFRTKATLSDPQLWARMHRVMGAVWVLSGLVVVGVALTAAEYALLSAVGALLVSSLAGLALLSLFKRNRS